MGDRRRRLLLNGCCCLLLALMGCSAVDYVAPEGTTLTLTANPSTVPVNGGTSTLTVVGTKTSGFPLPDGTVITFITTLGSVTPQAEIHGGVATAVLASTGQSGEASVTARSGNAVSEAVVVTIGVAATTLTLTATPATLPAGGGTSNLVAVVFDDSGVPIQGATVVFQTTGGTLFSGGSPVVTNSRGEATDTLTTTVEASVTATAGSASDNITVPVEDQSVSSILLSANPTTLPITGGSTQLTAVVFGATGPLEAVGVAFKSTAGTLGNSGVILTNSLGEATNTLTTSQSATVTASAGAQSDTVDVTLGGEGVYVTLTMSRNSITDTTTLPGADPCGASANRQVPVELFAQVTDGAGNPIEGRNVIFQLDFSVVDPCGRAFGNFCPDLDPQISDITDANGVARATLGVDDDDFAFCNAIVTECCENCGTSAEKTLFCQVGITAESGSITGGANQGIIEWGQ
jgi:hypothetical protein